MVYDLTIRALVHAAALTLALHETLLRQGVTAAQSHRLRFSVGWSIYRRMAEPPMLVASAFTRDLRKRLKLATDLVHSFPFDPPSYKRRDTTTSDNAIAFDGLKSPAAEFLAAPIH